MDKVLYIIDASAYIHRAYHAIRPLTTSAGIPTNAVYGFIKLINKIKNEQKPDYIAVCFDHPSKNFRHQLSPVYKANRKQIDEDLIKQMPIARESVKAMNLASFEMAGFEADDVIGTVAKKAEKEGIKVVIVTGDKDLFQLVNDNIHIWNEAKNIMFDNQKVFEKYGLYPDKIVDMLALMGDNCDNVCGVKGIGEKTAVKLINTYGSVEDIIANADSIKGKISQAIKDGANDVLLSKKLVQLELNVPINVSIENMKFNDNLFETAQDFFKKYELYSFIKNNPQQNDFKLEQENKESVPVQQVQQNVIHKETKNVVKIVDTTEKANGLKQNLLQQKEISVNIETAGSGIMQDLIVGVSLCYGQDNNYYIPINHNDFILQQIPQDDFVEIFKPVFENENIKFTGCDLKFIKHILKTLNIELKNISFDVMIASYCINPSQQHTIENLALKYLNFYIKTDEEIFSKGTKKIKADNIDIETLADYSCSKSISLYNLKDILLNKLKTNNLSNLFYDIEMPIVQVLYEMEDTGIKTDKKFLDDFDKELINAISVIEQKIYNLAGETFNINSPKQLAVVLFEKLKLPVIKKTKTGYSTDESVLAELSQFDIANEILKYRELQKLKSTYVDSTKRFIETEGERIHTIFNQAITTTGRLSSSDPNLQNIPIRTEYGRKFRKAFVADEGNIFVSADYSQIDLRSLAHISKDTNLIKAFCSGQDIHTATAMEVFNIANKEDVTKQQRMAAKSINFGIVYGISSFGLSKQLDIPVKQAKEYIDSYFSKYVGIKNWSNRIIEETKQKGYVKTITGRIRYIPEINSSNKQIVAFGERMALNTPVQGTSADIIKIAMINVSKKLKEQNLKSKILLQVHDDLLLEVPKEEENIVINMLKYEMEHAIKLDVPLLVEVKVGKNWADLTTVEKLKG
ncbi:MAG: DNA polymerase I [Endomicrobiaceae bacterium]|nr:DNA polymerase I [Endomicrobiaceae bacterium]